MSSSSALYDHHVINYLDCSEIESVAIKCRLCLGELDQNAVNMFDGKDNSSISVQLLEIFQLEVGFVSQQRAPENKCINILFMYSL